MFQSEAKSKAIDMKIVFYCHEKKNRFHKKCFALSLVLKVGVFGTWKWPIIYPIKAQQEDLQESQAGEKCHLYKMRAMDHSVG